MKPIFLLFIIFLFSSCEVYHRYFIMASNRYGAVKITVKVHSVYDLPKQYIPASKNLMGCNTNTNTENNFVTKIDIVLDSSKMQYSFILPVCNTVWLQPSKIGIPALEYIIVDGRDTVAISSSVIKTISSFAFKSLPSQKYLLTIR
jgi:hypothetical protein